MTLRDLVQPFVPTLQSLIIFFFVVYIPLYLFSITFFGRRTRKSPFVFPSLLKGATSDNVPSEKRQRDAILRQYFNPKRVPSRVDVIVVGSGPAGLVTAALLARSGVHVLVLERRAAAGGLQTEESCVRQFEMEQHWSVAPGTIPRMVLDQVTNGQVQWSPMEPDFDSVCVFRSGTFLHRTTVTKGCEVFQRRLIETFPNEAGAIRRYFELLNAADASWWLPLWAKLFPFPLVFVLERIGVLSLMSPFFRHARRSLQDVLDELTSCDELKTLLSYATLARGEAPRQESFVAHAVRTKQLLDDGGFYPKGGYEELAFRMGTLIEGSKGKILVSADVTELLTDGRRVLGVRVVTDSKAVDIFARTVVLAEGLATANGLLPSSLQPRAPWLAEAERLARPEGPATFHFHFWLTPSDDGESHGFLRSQNLALCFKRSGRSDEQALEEWLQRPVEEACRQPPPFAVLSVPSAKDAAWAERQPNGRALLVLSLPAPLAWAAQLRADGALRQRLLDGLWGQLCRVRPGLEACEVTETALRVEDTRRALAELPQRFKAPLQLRLRPNCGVRGLLFSGSDLTAGGPIGELRGALLCASYFLNRNLAEELDKMASGTISKRATRIRR